MNDGRLAPLDPLDAEAPRRRLIGIYLLPSAATLGNLLCGFLAIFCCLLSIRSEYFPGAPAPRVHPHIAQFFPSFIATGCYLIVGAMVFDALDGRLARMARRTTEFGAQLDSIADIVSFGVAPAALFLTLLLRLAAPAEGDAITSKLQWRLGMSCCLVYVSCAAIRLARYNAENVKDESAQQRFSGLPSPGAAAALVALLLLHEDLSYHGGAALGVQWDAVLRWLAIPAIFGLGALMVSRLNYVHMFNVYVRRRHPPTHLIWIVLALGIGLFSPQILLVVLAYGYVFTGLVRSIAGWRSGAAGEAPEEAGASHDSEAAGAGPLQSPR